MGAVSNPPYFDDWKWSTGKRCIGNEVTFKKIHTLSDFCQKYQQEISFSSETTIPDPFIALDMT